MSQQGNGTEFLGRFSLRLPSVRSPAPLLAHSGDRRRRPLFSPVGVARAHVLTENQRRTNGGGGDQDDDDYSPPFHTRPPKSDRSLPLFSVIILKRKCGAAATVGRVVYVFTIAIGGGGSSFVDKTAKAKHVSPSPSLVVR